jgi:hypothetical protein
VAMSSRASAAELVQILAIVRSAAVVVDAEFAGVAGAKPDGLVSIQATEDADVLAGAI